MKILLFGKTGQIGWELNRSLQPLGEIITPVRDEADFSDPDSLRDIVRRVQPDTIVNAAAYTAVDKAETEEALATAINSAAPGVLAEEAGRINALMVHYSTDYVFDGNKTDTYTEKDTPNPINAYGRSKLAGERAIQQTDCDHLILRTSWVYSTRGHNFLLSILKLASERETLNIVSDQTGAPTWARTIADTSGHVLYKTQADRALGKFKSDVYHLTASGRTTWFDFAAYIIDVAKASIINSKIIARSIYPISTKSYITAASRPLNSCLQTKKLENDFEITLPDWRIACALCMEELQS